jgi:hypothetical protein
MGLHFNVAAKINKGITYESASESGIFWLDGLRTIGTGKCDDGADAKQGSVENAPNIHRKGETP